MSSLIVFDADNTLWDTNAVFQEAQISLLRVFAQAGHLDSPEGELDTLREIDRALIKLSGQFEYDFRWLANAVNHYYSGTNDAERSANYALQEIDAESTSVIEQSYEAFVNTLAVIPSLFEDTKEVLQVLTRARTLKRSIVLILFSDGRPERIGRILSAHNLENIFDDVVIERKSVDSFKKVRMLGFKQPAANNSSAVQAFMVGDSLKRDIAPANQAGFFTIYKPAGFLGIESPSNNAEEPDSTIQSLSELPDLLGRIGVLLNSNDRAHANRKAVAGTMD